MRQGTTSTLVRWFKFYAEISANVTSEGPELTSQHTLHARVLHNAPLHGSSHLELGNICAAIFWSC